MLRELSLLGIDYIFTVSLLDETEEQIFTSNAVLLQSNFCQEIVFSQSSFQMFVLQSFEFEEIWLRSMEECGWKKYESNLMHKSYLLPS